MNERRNKKRGQTTRAPNSAQPSLVLEWSDPFLLLHRIDEELGIVVARRCFRGRRHGCGRVAALRRSGSGFLLRRRRWSATASTATATSGSAPSACGRAGSRDDGDVLLAVEHVGHRRPDSGGQRQRDVEK